MPSLLLELADAEPGPVGLDDERGDSFALAIGDREADIEVGDTRFEIQFFVPLITHSSPSSTAVVFIPRGPSRPRALTARRPGSTPPVAHFGRKRSFSSSEPNSLDRQRAELLHHQDQRAGGVDLRDLLDRHVQHQRAGAGPPYSTGNGSPRMSCSARILRMSHGYSACSSISASVARSAHARSGRSSRRSRGSPENRVDVACRGVHRMKS